jgi:hypothetical protein
MAPRTTQARQPATNPDRKGVPPALRTATGKERATVLRATTLRATDLRAPTLRAAKRDAAAAQSPSPGATATGYPGLFNGADPQRQIIPTPPRTTQARQPATNPDRKGGVPRAQRTATGRERATTLRAPTLRAAKRDAAAAQSPSPGAIATGYPRLFNGAAPSPATVDFCPAPSRASVCHGPSPPRCEPRTSVSGRPLPPRPHRNQPKPTGTTTTP